MQAIALTNFTLRRGYVDRVAAVVLAAATSACGGTSTGPASPEAASSRAGGPATRTDGVFGGCVVPTPPASPPGQMCTEMACVPGLSIAFAERVWPAGSYRFELANGSKTVTCDATIPLPPCDRQPEKTCSDDRVQLGLSGCALPAGSHGFTGVNLPVDCPETLVVRVLRDRKPMATAELAPQYRAVAPNGPSCPGHCLQASAQIAVSDAPTD
jgi:hypothetical protein